MQVPEKNSRKDSNISKQSSVLVNQYDTFQLLDKKHKTEMKQKENLKSKFQKQSQSLTSSENSQNKKNSKDLCFQNNPDNNKQINKISQASYKNGDSQSQQLGSINNKSSLKFNQKSKSSNQQKEIDSQSISNSIKNVNIQNNKKHSSQVKRYNQQQQNQQDSKPQKEGQLLRSKTISKNILNFNYNIIPSKQQQKKKNLCSKFGTKNLNKIPKPKKSNGNIQINKVNSNSQLRKNSNCSSKELSSRLNFLSSFKEKSSNSQRLIEDIKNKKNNQNQEEQKSQKPEEVQKKNSQCFNLNDQKKLQTPLTNKTPQINSKLSQDQKTSQNTKEKLCSASPQTCNSLNPILLVDDTVFNITILQMLLKSKYQIESDLAVSGDEAIMKCKQRTSRNQETYKLIVMDINMPGMDGRVATNKIREFSDPYVKLIEQKDYMIVAHTAIPEDQFGDFKKKGFDGFLQKPLVNDQLLKFLKKVHLK